MKTRFITVLFVLALVPMCLSAAFLQVGPTYTIDVPVDPEAEKIVDVDALDFSSYRIGMDGRINLGYLQLKGGVTGTVTEDLRVDTFGVDASAGIRTNLKLIEFVVGGGIKATVASDEGKWLINGAEFTTLEDACLSSSIFYRAGLSLNLGKLSLTVDGNVPVDLTVADLSEDQHQSILDSFTPDLSRTTVSIGLLLKLI